MERARPGGLNAQFLRVAHLRSAVQTNLLIRAALSPYMRYARLACGGDRIRKDGGCLGGSARGGSFGPGGSAQGRPRVSGIQG